MEVLSPGNRKRGAFFTRTARSSTVCRPRRSAAGKTRVDACRCPAAGCVTGPKTAGGIIIPDSAGEKPEQGEVVAVGPGRRDDQGRFVAPTVAAGDKVLFGKYSGQTVKVDGDELLVVREEDLFAIIEK